MRPTTYTIATGYATNILAGGPIKLLTAGVINAAAAGDRSIGAFMGVRYIDADGVTKFSNKWTASTTGTEIECWVTEDPNIFYEIQANGTLAITDIGNQYDWSAESGNTTVGNSNVSLAILSVAGNAGLQVVGLRAGPDNGFGDAFPIVTVRISEHQFVADVPGF